jgi:plasmid stabilization system protein ParE
MTYHVIVTPTADDEAMEAVRWYAERSPDAAQRWRDGLTRAISSLAKLPTRCPVSTTDSQALGCEVRILLYGKRRGVYASSFLSSAIQYGCYVSATVLVAPSPFDPSTHRLPVPPKAVS